MKVNWTSRFYPSVPQDRVFDRSFHDIRFVFNKTIDEAKKAYAEKRKFGYADWSLALTAWKKTPECAFLNRTRSVVLQQAQRDLWSAYQNFFAKRSRYPRFKSYRDKQSATYTRGSFKYEPNNRNLWITGVGRLDVHWSREFKSDPSTVTITRHQDGKYFVTMTLDETIAHLPKTGLSVGIDLGLTNMVTLSTGEQFESPRYLQQASRKLRSAQKALSRCKKGSNGYARQRDIVARLHAKVAACRKDFADKLTTDLVRRFDVIAIENLNIKGMMKNRRLAKSCSDVSMGQIRRMLEYKTAMYGKTLLVVDRFFPSSKMCSACGHVHKEMPLKVRKFICEGCGKEWDRDINAAINILANGKPVGERVKPAKVARKPRSAEDKSPILICAADLLVPAGAAEVVEAACAAE